MSNEDDGFIPYYNETFNKIIPRKIVGINLCEKLSKLIIESSNVEELNQLLTSQIQYENYEAAALIRDEIKIKRPN